MENGKTEMIFHALHSNGQVYAYDPNDKDDRDAWFECGTGDVKSVVLMRRGVGPMGYEYVGVEVSKEYVNGAMDHGRALEDAAGKED